MRLLVLVAPPSALLQSPRVPKPTLWCRFWTDQEEEVTRRAQLPWNLPRPPRRLPVLLLPRPVRLPRRRPPPLLQRRRHQPLHRRQPHRYRRRQRVHHRRQLPPLPRPRHQLPHRCCRHRLVVLQPLPQPSLEVSSRRTEQARTLNGPAPVRRPDPWTSAPRKPNPHQARRILTRTLEVIMAVRPWLA